ncbi:MAG: methyltransferase domain-containing protein [Acidobacteriota bacterium]|nr:methyltransferase domain-containing protein [Acidobacteriota bacterium]
MRFPEADADGYPQENSLSKLEYSVIEWPAADVCAGMSHRTRKVYDNVAAVYPLSTMLFHSNAHRCALDMSGIQDGMRVLEVATGSGEMFRRIVRANRNGATVGIDISPNMAARTQKRARLEFPASAAHCQAVDARHMPFRDGSFDAVMCCYLLELLPVESIVQALAEIYRVLRRRGRLTLILIGQNAAIFNEVYKMAGKIAPAFWGRQVEQRIPELIEARTFEILHDEKVKQIFYPSRVLVARK